MRKLYSQLTINFQCPRTVFSVLLCRQCLQENTFIYDELSNDVGIIWNVVMWIDQQRDDNICLPTSDSFDNKAVNPLTVKMNATQQMK
jgi:hypothetical protein